MHEKAIEALEMEHALRAALDRGAIDVHYQPIVDARTNEVTSLEALVRWTENGRNVAPNDFIPLAEESGIIVALGTYVLERACAMCAALTETHPDLTMCVNISARQFREVEFAARVDQALKHSGLDPRRLQLEITESAYISAELGVRNVEALDALGVQLSIDDFGTGYSALGYLKRLSLDALKIDRSFVTDIVTDAADQAIVRAIIAVARNLDLEVIAEGVETAEQAAMLRMLGCTQLQGFYFSRPLPPDRLIEYLHA
jgi:EAL domain-containing protein (putative c-di-GMP-specific phosphodiesterase class I)